MFRFSLADPAPSLEGCRVLIVEDNAVNQLVTEEMVDLLGMIATTVDDGRAALERLERDTFDVVSIDCQMPVMDGFEAMCTWRAREAERGDARLPVVAVMANAVVGDRALPGGRHGRLRGQVGRVGGARRGAGASTVRGRG